MGTLWCNQMRSEQAPERQRSSNLEGSGPVSLNEVMQPLGKARTVCVAGFGRMEVDVRGKAPLFVLCKSFSVGLVQVEREVSHRVL